MPGLKLFASEQYPLRASRLYWYMCQMRYALEQLGYFDPDTGGVAAQTGSLTHAGIQAWHEHDRDLEEALRAMRAAVPPFPAPNRPRRKGTSFSTPRIRVTRRPRSSPPNSPSPCGCPIPPATS
jgi:hypothetical protein